MTATNTAAPSGPLIDPQDVQQQTQDLFRASAAWFNGHWLQILIAIAVGALIVVVLHAGRNLGAKLARRSKTGKGWPAVFGHTIQKTGTFFIVMLAAKLVVRYAGAPGQVTDTINFFFTIAVVFQAAVWARELIIGAIERRAIGEHYAGEALGSAIGLIRVLVSFAVFAIALVVVLDNLGVNVTGLVAGLGVGGIAIGLAAQGIFADLFAALAIIFDRPFRRGDSVAYDDADASVEAIGLKSTRLRAFTGEELIISNKNLLDKQIQNNTKRNHRRARFAIGVTYQTPPDVCAAIPGMLKEIVEAHERVFVRCGFIGFGASSLDFQLDFDSPGPDYAAFYDGRTAIGLAILKRFNDEGIEIAYPTQTTFTAAPDGTMVMPYAEVQPVRAVNANPIGNDAG
jgi:small-conductance mechanosensitive channel